MNTGSTSVRVDAKAFNLDEYKPLFRDELSFQEFATALKKGLEQDLRPIVCGEQVLGSVLSAQGTKDVLYDRLIKRITERPSFLDELTDRIENDEIVE